MYGENMLLHAAKAFLDEQNWPYQQINDTEAHDHLQLAVASQHMQWICDLQIFPQSELFVFYSRYPKYIPNSAQLRLMEFVTRANAGLPIGNFELALDAGELRFKTSFDAENLGDHLASLVRTCVFSNLACFERYLPGIELVLETQLSPAQAVAACESQS